MNIDINGISITLTSEQLDQIHNQTIKKKPKIFPQRGEQYYFCDVLGSVDSRTAEDGRGRPNVYKTQFEALQAYEISLAKMRVKHAIATANAGWVPDWSKNSTEHKYYFMMDTTTETVTVSNCCSYKSHPSAMYVKSEELAHKIIDKYEEDLLLILSE